VLFRSDVDEALVLSDRVYIMAGVPGRITEEIKILSENKENFAFTEQYLIYKREVLSYIA
jgi:ABC-type nitrate/sulfonate/bicarbonate transport system ATPase subunit